MSKQVQKRRGTSLEHASFTGALAEITVDTETNELVLGDGATPGGRRVGISRVTTSDLINSVVKYPQDDVIETCGFTAAGDGGAGKWKQNGVTGQTPSQAPEQLGGALLNDANGSQWSLVNGKALLVESLGLPNEDLVKLAASWASSNGFDEVYCYTDFEISSTIEIVSENLSIHLGCNITSSAALNDSVVTVHNSNNLKIVFNSLSGNRASVGDAVAGLNCVTVTNSTNITVSDSFCGGSSNHGIIFTSNSEGGVAGVALANLGPVKYCRSINNTVSDVGNGAIIFQTGSNGWATGNICDTFKNEGIQMIDSWDTGVISENKVTADESTAIILEQHEGRGVDAKVSNIVISSNIIKTNWHGIGLEHKEEPFANIVIQGNVINMLNETPLTLGAIVTTNEGVKVDRLVIDGNVIKGNTTTRLNDGVRIYRGGNNTGYVDSVIISNNSFEGLRYPIAIAGGDNTDNVIINGNRVKAGGIGIQVLDRTAFIVSNNSLEQCNQGFIKVSTTLASNSRGGIISCNTMKFANSALTYGITIENGAGSVEYYQVKNNYIDVLDATSATAIIDSAADANSQVSGNLVR